MRLEGRGEKRQTPPFPTRQTKAKKASEQRQRDRPKEVDGQRERDRMDREGGRKRGGQPKSDKEAGGGGKECGRLTVPEATDG